MSSHGGTLSPEHLLPGAALLSPLQAPTEHHSPVLNQAAGHGSSGQSAVITGFPLPAIPTKSPPGKLAAAPNPHRRPTPHRFPAGSFFGGFRTPAILPGPPPAPGRHPKPFPKAGLWADVPFIPLGEYWQATVYRKDLTDVLPGCFATFYGVRRA